MLVTEQRYGLVQGTPNAGFVQSLWLLRTSSVVAVLDPTQLPVVNRPMTVHRSGLLVSVGATVTRLVPPARTSTFGETRVTDRSGTGYAQTLTISLPKPTVELNSFLFKNQGARWVAFWQDGNGQGWIAGEPTNGLRLSTTQVQADANALTLMLTGLSTHPTWRLDSTDLAELFPEAGFDHSFELSFDS